MIADVVDGGEVALPDDVAHRFVRVLRLKDGDVIEVFDGAGAAVRGALIVGPPARLVDASLVAHDAALPPLVVAQAVVKTDKLEQVVQRATELGASSVLLFEARRGVVKMGDKAAARVLRLARVAEDAARQCERARVPEVLGPISVVELSARVRAFAGVAAQGVLHAPRALSDVLAADPRFESGGLLIVVGPEGGLDDDEVRALREAGAIDVALGVHVLRTETAALAALAAAQAVVGRL